MFCPNCGSQVPDGTQFCGVCGSRIIMAAVQTDHYPKPQQIIQQPQDQQPQQPQYQAYQQPQQPQQPQYQPYRQPQYQQPVSRNSTQSRSSAKIILGLLGAVLIIGSIFLPYRSFFGMDINMLDAEPDLLIDGFADTWLFLGLAVIGGVFAVANIGIGQLFAGLASLGLWVYELVVLIDSSALDLVSIGFYGLAVGSLVLLIGGLVSMAKKKE